jgi:hydrogenase maturation protein HypF
MLTLTDLPCRQAIRVRGGVQGVGFRPFVSRLAQESGLSGWVVNDAEGVLIEVQGSPEVLSRFQYRLRNDAPPLARIEALESRSLAPLEAEDGFDILASRGGRITTAIAPDAATCPDCLNELFDPFNRRHRYAFINCTQCGPRYTIVNTLPYDRARTSMAAFAMCADCLREYEDPSDRRFHAEPNACPACGPRLSLVDGQGAALDGDPVDATVDLLKAGRIVAIKGLGGFHLACDARNPAAVALLRHRKQRDEKPFAVMVADLAAAAGWVELGDPNAQWLKGPERPIVLLPLRKDRPDPLTHVASGLSTLGVMLPTTPIQFLLFHAASDLILVMTSANPGGEPLVTDNAEALRRLSGLADAWLLHDRDIVSRCDDSVIQGGTDGAPRFIRRARGWSPRPIRLARSGPSVLATGAGLKNTICITRGDEAFVSPHIGDLDSPAACAAMAQAVSHLCTLLDVQPQVVAHDLHPDFFSTRFAAEFAAANGLPRHAVQHHHAHIAAVAAEHRHGGPLIGLALDGFGLGSDGGSWGGELLRVDGGAFERLGHFAQLPMPGGDAAAREPWRMAAGALQSLGRGAEIRGRYAVHRAAAAVAEMLASGLRCPPTSSAGRWFDAAAGLLSVCERAGYEGQAPMQLEALSARAVPQPVPDGLVEVGDVLDLRPLLARLADEPDPARGACLFHDALADGLARWALRACTLTKIDTVALGGGCFLNTLLCGLLVPRLQRHGLQVLQAQQAPPNDGGIALGQAWAALCLEGD